jgi:hypothetical protein
MVISSLPATENGVVGWEDATLKRTCRCTTCSVAEQARAAGLRAAAATELKCR